MAELGKWLVVVGALILAAGLVISFAPGLSWLGRLPGDVTIERGGIRIFLPITTCVVVSVVLSLVLHVVSRIR